MLGFSPKNQRLRGLDRNSVKADGWLFTKREVQELEDRFVNAVTTGPRLAGNLMFWPAVCRGEPAIREKRLCFRSAMPKPCSFRQLYGQCQASVRSIDDPAFEIFCG